MLVGVEAPVRHAAGPLQLLAAPLTDDGVTGRRVEMKFALRHADVQKLRGVLETNFRRVVHKDSVSLVSSIYFDDVRLSAARENQSGSDRRSKMRLRWYDRHQPGTELVLEIKRRDNRTISKERFPIRSRVPLEELTYAEVLSELGRILPDAARERLLLRPEPILISEYRREHFRSWDGPLRVSLDCELAAYEQIGCARPRKGFATPLLDLAVLEVKVPLGEEASVQGLLRPLRLRLTRNSKYVLGCRALGLATGVSGPVDA